VKINGEVVGTFLSKERICIRQMTDSIGAKRTRSRRASARQSARSDNRARRFAANRLSLEKCALLPRSGVCPHHAAHTRQNYDIAEEKYRCEIRTVFPREAARKRGATSFQLGQLAAKDDALRRSRVRSPHSHRTLRVLIDRSIDRSFLKVSRLAAA
jgi:hypothetical protein